MFLILYSNKIITPEKKIQNYFFVGKNEDQISGFTVAKKAPRS